MLLDVYDDQFESIKGLSWLPWVGANYGESSIKILLVGESHYVETDEEKTRATNNPLVTRWVIEESIIDRDWTAKTYDNLHRTLLGCSSISDIYKRYDISEMWSNLSYYNFIQKPMEYNSELQQRPSWEDWCFGWMVFSNVINILKPTVCLFVGVSASDAFNDMKNRASLRGEIEKDDPISNCAPRYAKLNCDGDDFKAIFVRHAGGAYSWEKWHRYLAGKIPNEMEFFTRFENL